MDLKFQIFHRGVIILNVQNDDINDINDINYQRRESEKKERLVIS